MEYTEEEILSLLKKVAKEKMPQGTIVKLFGSRARGEAKEDSDWDVLILLDKDKPTFEDKDMVFNEFFEVGLLTNQFINTIIFSKKQWQESYFTPFYKNVEQDGIILFMSLNEEEKRILISIRLAKSEDAMKDVSLLLKNSRWVLLANRLYYSAYYTVSALLIAYGYTAKTHDGINQIFNRFFGQTGILPLSLTRLYSRLLNLKITGDYSDNYEILQEDVLPLVEPTKELIEQVSLLAKKKIGLE